LFNTRSRRKKERKKERKKDRKQRKSINKKYSSPSSWRHIGTVQIELHSFLTSSLHGSGQLDIPAALTPYPLHMTRFWTFQRWKKFLRLSWIESQIFNPQPGPYLNELSRLPHYIKYTEFYWKPNPDAGKCNYI
jgi:hypothetical protein